MSLPLHVELRLEERSDDSVVVSVLLTPAHDDAQVDGVAMQLQNREGQALGPRLVLPIAGALTAPMRSTVQLRSTHDIPRGSRVAATAWRGTRTEEFSIPSDPRTALWTHLQAKANPATNTEEGQELRDLASAERSRLSQHFPWIERLHRPQVLDAEPEEPDIDDVVKDLDLDEETAEWLRDIVAETNDDIEPT